MNIFGSALKQFALGCSVCVLTCSPLAAALLVGIGQNFTGATYQQDSVLSPADANGAIGPNHFAELINGHYSVFKKTNGVRVQSMTDIAFWSHAGASVPANWLVTDPRIVYDPSVQRWFASMVDFDPSRHVKTNRFLLAISASADPTGVWKSIAFASDPSGAYFADFPTLGLDAQAVYLGADFFDAAENPAGPTLVAIPKADLLASTPSAAQRTSFGLLSYSTRGDILQPVVALNEAGGGDVLAVGDLGRDFLPHSELIASTILNSDGPDASLSQPTVVSVPPYLVPINPPQPDGSKNLDDGDARLSALVYQVGGMVFAVHGTEVNHRAAIRWYRISATNHVLLESGTISDPVLDLFYPSIAANSNGVMMIGCNGSSLSSFVSAYAIAGETINGTTTFGSLLLLKSGMANYNVNPPQVSRWGDYSATSVDPTDPNRFWTIQMYPSAPLVWSTQITELLTSRFQLSIVQTNTNVLVCWPVSAAGFQLQTTTSLSASNSWTLAPQARFTNDNQICVLAPASGSAQFFRLREGPGN